MRVFVFQIKKVSARKRIATPPAALSPLENSASLRVDRIFRLDVSNNIIYIYGDAGIVGWA
jgi:hypothetical protein